MINKWSIFCHVTFIQSDLEILLVYFKVGWIPRDFLYSRIDILELFCWFHLRQLFMLDLLSKKNFRKNHKFWSKIHFLRKKDEFERSFLGLPGWDYAHSKENFFLYQNRLRWQPGNTGISQNMEEKGGHLVIFWYFLELFSNFFLEKYPNQFKV